MQAGPADPRELWLPPPLTSRGRSQGLGRGTQNSEGAHAFWTHRENGGTGRERNPEQGASADAVNLLRELGRDNSNSAHTEVEEDALFSTAEQREPADNFLEERRWQFQQGRQGQASGWHGEGGEWKEPAMAPLRKEQGQSSGDFLEPSASAVRGFRALLEAALRAPGAFGGERFPTLRH